MNDSYLAVCAIFRNESPFLYEWIRFHLLQGVEHFYLYDNQSDDAPHNILAPFVEQGLVTLTHWDIPFHHGAQTKAYYHCLEHSRGHARWVAFIDIDEFLFAPGNRPLTRVLPDYETFPGVVVHWQVYGSGGQVFANSEPVISRFLKRGPDNWARNRKIKSIVNPERTLRPRSMHHFVYHDDALAVDEHCKPVCFGTKRKFKKQRKYLFGMLGPIMRYLNLDPYAGAEMYNKKISVDRLRINHYAIKSREEYDIKSQLKAEKRRYEDVDYFLYHDRNEIHDPVLQTYADSLRP